MIIMISSLAKTLLLKGFAQFEVRGVPLTYSVEIV